MVRHDPINERGPRPGAGRGRRVTAKPTIFTLRPLEEYAQLWMTVTSNVRSSFDQLATLVHLRMPGVQLDDLLVLKKQLDNIVKEIEARNAK